MIVSALSIISQACHSGVSTPPTETPYNQATIDPTIAATANDGASMQSTIEDSLPQGLALAKESLNQLNIAALHLTPSIFYRYPPTERLYQINSIEPTKLSLILLQCVRLSDRYLKYM